MEISAEKIKLMTINTSGINAEIKVNGQKLETVTSFMYQGSVIMEQKIMHSKILFLNLSNLNIIGADRKYMYFLKATKLVTVCVHR